MPRLRHKTRKGWKMKRRKVEEQPSVVVDSDGCFDDNLAARQYLSQRCGICANCLIEPCICNKDSGDIMQDLVIPALVTLFFVMITSSAIILIFS